VHRRLLAVPVLVALVLLGPACGGSTGPESTVTVFAASSLTAPFTEIEAAFEAEHPDIDVVFSFAASSALATQITEGAPADVFASADTVTMDRVADRLVGESIVFATNRLQIVTEPGNPLGIATLADLADPSILFVTCAPEVPIGAYTAEALAKAGVTVSPVSFEENVKGIVTKVATGEADAGVVYTTDVIAAGSSVTGVDVPDEFDVSASYPIGRVSADESARTFVEFVTSSTVREILEDFGFGAP
jgi:molybdate transport system substrate-binding protein